MDKDKLVEALETVLEVSEREMGRCLSFTAAHPECDDALYLEEYHFFRGKAAAAKSILKLING